MRVYESMHAKEKVYKDICVMSNAHRNCYIKKQLVRITRTNVESTPIDTLNQYPASTLTIGCYGKKGAMFMKWMSCLLKQYRLS